MAAKRKIGRYLIALATIAGGFWAVVSPPSLSPAAAQFFPFFAPFQRAPAQPKPEPHVDYSHAPAAKKPETPPTTSIVVMGDSMADWLAYGLEQAYADRPEIGIERKNRPYSGLIRYEAKSDLDWPHVAHDILATENPAAVVMILGLSDRRSIHESDVSQDSNAPDAQGKTDKNAKAPQPKREKDQSFPYRSDRWAELYAKLIDKTIVALKSKGVPVLWVGLPAVCCAKSTSDTAYLDDLYRTEAEKAGIIYVDAWDGFVDDNGKYTSYGPDVEGQRRRLRTPDGVYFTEAGARKLAHYVERELNRVMSVRGLPVMFPSDGVQPGLLRPGLPRPVAGPILPLTGGAVPIGQQLVGGGSVRRGTADPVAARVLVKGDPLAPQKGRADDFALSPDNGAATSKPAAKSSDDKSVSAPQHTSPAAATPPAAKNQGDKGAATHGKAEKQTKQSDKPAADAKRSEAAAIQTPRRKRPSPPRHARDVPRPPAPIGASSGFVPFNWFH